MLAPVKGGALFGWRNNGDIVMMLTEEGYSKVTLVVLGMVVRSEVRTTVSQRIIGVVFKKYGLGIRKNGLTGLMAVGLAVMGMVGTFIRPRLVSHKENRLKIQMLSTRK